MIPDARSAAIAITGMAAITYTIRAAGLFVARALPSTPIISAFLKHLGGAVIVALVTATLARGDVPGLVATVVTVALAGRRPTTALMAGMAAAALLRAT